MNSHAATVAKNAPAARLGKDRAVLIGSDASDALQQRVLQTAAGLFDYLVPLERFDEALLLLADELGLRHVPVGVGTEGTLPPPGGANGAAAAHGKDAIAGTRARARSAAVTVTIEAPGGLKNQRIFGLQTGVLFSNLPLCKCRCHGLLT